LGRNVKYYDMPTVRAIVRNAARQDYRLSSIVLGIATSGAFQMDRLPTELPGAEGQKVALQ
jgi:Protein of unknown function (DUF1585)